MTDLDHGQAQRLPAAYPEMTSDYKQLTSTSMISPGCLTSPGDRSDHKEDIRTVETEHASIKFVGGIPAGGSFSESDSEEDQQNDQGLNSVSELLGDIDDSSNPIGTGVKLKSNPDGIHPQQVLNASNKSEQVRDYVTCHDNKHQKGARNNHNESGEVTPSDTAESECMLPAENDLDLTRKNKMGREDKGQCDKDLNRNSPDLSPHVDKSSISSVPVSDCSDHVARMRQTRFNPFDRDVVFEEDHFATPQHSFLEASRDYRDQFSPGKWFVWIYKFIHCVVGRHHSFHLPLTWTCTCIYFY